MAKKKKDLFEKLEEEDKDIIAENLYLKEVNAFYEHLPERSINQSVPKFLNNPLVFYRTILSLCKPQAEELNKYINEFLTLKGEEKTVAKNHLISSYWSFLTTLFGDTFESFSPELRYVLRFGMIVTSNIAASVYTYIREIPLESEYPKEYTLYYADEWLQAVSNGKLNQTIIDETVISAEGKLKAEQRKIEQMQGQIDILVSQASALDREMEELIDSAMMVFDNLKMRSSFDEYNFSRAITKDELRAFKNATDQLNVVRKKNEELDAKMVNIKSTKNSVAKTKDLIQTYKEEVKREKVRKLRNEDNIFDKKKKKGRKEGLVNSKTLVDELEAIKQMMKAAIGKRGNQFPILMKDFYSGPVKDMGIKDHVIREIRNIEEIDYTIFQRRIKHHSSRFFPNILLAPCYGVAGICWEPFEMTNRNNSTSKIVIPMYTPNLNRAIVYALGDYRWQYAKEYAGYRWMEEGLTGKFFFWYSKHIKKGDIKAAFIEQYILWIKWESTGAQKLDKDLRFVFWHHIPFSQELRKKLAERSTVYSEMVKKEAQLKARKASM